MKKVLVTRRIPEEGIELLRSAAEVTVSELDRDLSGQEIVEMGQGCTVLLTMLSNRIDGELLDAVPTVRMVANYAVGYDNIDLEAARRRSVVVTNTPGVLTETTAELTLALILDAARRVSEGDRLARSGGFTGIHPLFMLGMGLDGKTLGIYGLGRIGRAVARRARAFGMHIIYHNRHANSEADAELDARWVSFDELLSTSDVISINAPLTRHTRGAFDLAAFGRMRPGAVVVNTGRGPIIVEDDLADALERGFIAAAGLDVYQDEPAINPRLLALDNVVLCPHLGSATRECRAAMAVMVAQNVTAFLAGEEPPNRLV